MLRSGGLKLPHRDLLPCTVAMASLWSAVCNAMASDQDQALMREAILMMRDGGVVNKTGGLSVR